MKITKRQIRKVIKEAMTSDVDYQFDRSFKQMQAFGASPSDIADMEEIKNLYYQDLPSGEASPYLKRLASSVDTIIREQIPQDVYYWIFPDLLESVVLEENKVKDAYDKMKSVHGWVMKPENEWIRKMALKMLGDKDPPEKEEVQDAKVQAESRQRLTEKKSMGVMDAYKKLKGMYNWAMSDENKWVRDIMVDMLQSGDVPSEKVISSELEDADDPFAGARQPYVVSDQRSLEKKKVGDKTATGKSIEDIEKKKGSFIFLVDDGEIETYTKSDHPKAKGNYLLMKEEKALRYAVIREARARLMARKIALL